MGLMQAIFGAKPPFGTPPFAAPHPMTGGSEVPTTADNANRPHGLSGFIDRLAYPTNGLGQIGLALLAGGGGGLVNAAQLLMAQGEARRKAQMPNIEHVGDSIGVVDPTTGKFTPTYTAPREPSGFAGELQQAGIDPSSPEGIADLKTHITNSLDPYQSFSGPQGSYFGPRSGLPTALGLSTGAPTPVGKITVIPDPSPADAPPAGGVLDSITSQSESGNRDFRANGTILRSPAGAMGRMQVMPGTLARPGFGVTPGNPNDPNDIARVGSQYRSAMQSRYGGDLAKMWAAYNWGPGNVDKAVQAYGPDWLKAAPAETQAYVRRNLGMVGE